MDRGKGKKVKVSNIYWDSFKTFFKIGIFTLGGGYAMIPLIEEEVVNKHRWVDKDEMLDLIAIAQSCPGVFAINIAIFIGYKLRKSPSSSNSLRTTRWWQPSSVVSVLPSWP